MLASVCLMDLFASTNHSNGSERNTMLSNQSITLLRHGSSEIITMLTWPAGASIPKIGEHVVYYNTKQERRTGLIKKVEHEHVLNEGTATINVTLWIEPE